MEDALKEGREGTAPALCRILFEVARTRARHLGMTGDASEECALEFVQHMLTRDKGAPRLSLIPRDAEGRPSQAWLYRCADNFARNVRRRWRRLQYHEAPWPEWASAADDRLTWEPAGYEIDPAAAVLRQELVSRIEAAVSHLTPRQRDLFARHYLWDESVASLALTSGQTPHAVSQCLSNVRKRLRSLLERQGVDEAVAHEYLQVRILSPRPLASPPRDG